MVTKNGYQLCDLNYYYMQMNNSDQLLTRAEKERARKRAKRARESSLERGRHKDGNRQQNKCYRASDSEAERFQHFAAGQQLEANHRDLESESECLK